jgi:uncharacterized ferritin-like protein (DUF455 family)
VISVFELASDCLHTASIDEKLQVTLRASALTADKRIDYLREGEPLPISATVFPHFPELVEPRNLPRRGLASKQGRVALLHSLAHIELYAIHLAWDILYRFRNLPEGFYQDWVTVAAEEALHFSMLRGRLRQMGSEYGDLPAHRGLWDVAVDTVDDVLARLALVPRTMEARGLDVTPGMIEKLLQSGDLESAEILKRILHDEVGHVAIGSHWFRAICAQRGLDTETTYFDFVAQRLRGKIHGPINRELRRQAGFGESELDRLEQMA